MVLHLIKLAVGVNDLAHLKTVQAERRRQRRQAPRSPHWVYTRNTPRRVDDLLPGGSLYWVVRGVIRCRQELVGFEEDVDAEDGRKYCRIKVKRTIVPTAPRRSSSWIRSMRSRGGRESWARGVMGWDCSLTHSRSLIDRPIAAGSSSQPYLPNHDRGRASGPTLPHSS